MKLDLPIDVVKIIQLFTEKGYEVFIVGGAVRDVIAQRQMPDDWDFTTNATPDQIQALIPDSFYENEFGTVGVDRNELRAQFKMPALENVSKGHAYNSVINVQTAGKIHESLEVKNEHSNSEATSLKQSDESKHIFEITTYRTDGTYTDKRRPDAVNWGTTLEEDLLRRDFTINALAIGLELENVHIDWTKKTFLIPEKQINLIDPFGGIQDLAKQTIRTVGSPAARFQEDALRMLRAIRFAVQLGFVIEKQTLEAIQQHSNDIVHVSFERIRDEVLKMLGSSQPKLAIELMDQTGLLQHVLPELIETKNVEQGGHHNTDVWTHSLDAVQSCPSQDPIVRLATLLHDIAKPQTFQRQNNTITFYNHEIIGSRIASKIAKRFKLSKKDVDRVFTLVRYHMFHYEPELTDAAIRRFMRKVGLENINDMLDLRIGDRLGSGAKETSWRLEEMKKRMLSQLHQPFSIKDLAIDGTTLITELNMKPGPQIGEILKHLFEIVLENPEKNQREILIEESRKFLSSQAN